VTICPLSNLALRCVPTINNLPIPAYISAKVPFSINSDDPAYFGGYIQENYCAVQDAFKLSVQEWADIVVDSIMLSWCGEGRKEEMVRDLEGVLGRYGYGGIVGRGKGGL